MSQNNSKQYICLLRNQGGECQEPSSASDMEAMFAQYRQWQDQYADNIADMGGKLGSGGAVVQAQTVTDGPYIELKEILGGFMMLQADSLAEAVQVIKASPMMQSPDTSIEIREIHTS